MTASELVVELSHAMGLEPALELDEHRRCSLVLEGLVRIEFYGSEDDMHLSIHCAVAPVPSGKALRARLYPMLLSANLFGQGTADLTFGIFGSTDEIVLCTDIFATLCTADALLDRLEQLINMQRAWGDMLRPELVAQTVEGYYADEHARQVAEQVSERS